jgi:hypothetical protein
MAPHGVAASLCTKKTSIIGHSSSLAHIMQELKKDISQPLATM